MAKIYVGNLPFTREAEILEQPILHDAGKKFFDGKLSEGFPTSILPKGVRQELDQGNQVALIDFLRSARSEKWG